MEMVEKPRKNDRAKKEKLVQMRLQGERIEAAKKDNLLTEEYRKTCHIQTF